ncbi:MAG: class I SAM-dependent methyltransferase [Bacteroidota bacterium]
MTIETSGNLEALGQIGGSGDMEADIALCELQTIEPAFRRHLPRQGRILEAGSGRGRWVFYLRRLGYDVVGLELAKREIEAAKSFDPDAPILYGNVLKTDFVTSSFDAVISLGVVEHFQEGPQGAFAEVRRILKPGGIFLVTVPTQNLVRVLFVNRVKSLQLRVRRARRVPLTFEEYRYSRRQFRRQLDQAGFEVLEMVPDDFRPPKNMGLYTDSRLFQRWGRQWELNGFGKVVNGVLSFFSPWLHCSGTLWVCRR